MVLNDYESIDTKMSQDGMDFSKIIYRALLVPNCSTKSFSNFRAKAPGPGLGYRAERKISVYSALLVEIFQESTTVRYR